MMGTCPCAGCDGAGTRPCGAAPPVDSDGLLELGPFPPPGHGMCRPEEDSDADSRTLALLCCQPVDSTPGIVFQSSNRLSPLGGSPSCGTSPNQQNGWKMPCHATVMQSEDSSPKSAGSSASDMSQSLQDDDSPDLVVGSNNKLGPPLWLTQCHGGSPRRPPSHATNTPFKMALRTSHVPSTTSSWRHQGDSGLVSSDCSNDGANTWQVCLPSETTWRHQNQWKTPSRTDSSPSEMELTMSPISRTPETSRRQEDATPPLHQRRHSSLAPVSHRITEPPSPEAATPSGCRCQGGNDITPDIVLRYNDRLSMPPWMLAQRQHSSFAPSSQGLGRLSETAASVSSRCQDEGSDDNAPDTLHRYNNRFGTTPRITAQRRQSPWAPRSSCLVETALTESSTVTPPAKQWPYSLSNKHLWKGADVLEMHCHLDFTFNQFGHQGTFAKLLLEHRDTFPGCNEGCIANFCNPTTFKQH